MATVPSFTSWVDGQVVTADDLNGQIRDAGDFWKGVPRCRLRASSTQSIAKDTATALSWDTEDLDSDAMWSSGSKVYTPTAGLYVVTGQVAFASSGTGTRIARWYKNGGAVDVQTTYTGIAGNAAYLAPTILLPMAAGDYVELFVTQSSGAALNANPGSPNLSAFAAWWLAA